MMRPLGYAAGEIAILAALEAALALVSTVTWRDYGWAPGAFWALIGVLIFLGYILLEISDGGEEK